MKRSKGFTLIELLVVIAIIGLLLSVILPSLKRIKEKARHVICLSNHHQWGLAFNTYLQDYENKFMSGWISDAASRVDYDIWVEVLQPYYGDQYEILLCPSATRIAAEGGRAPYKAWVNYYRPYGSVVERRGSYMINQWVTNRYNHITKKYENKANSWKTSLVNYSKNRIPVIGAGGAVWRADPDHTDNLPRWEGDDEWRDGCSMPRFSTNRHEHGYTNILFMDWSARKVGLKELWTLKWHRGFNTANQYTIAGGMTPGQWPEWMRGFEDF